MQLRHTWLASNEADISVLGESGPSAAMPASMGIDGVLLDPVWDRHMNARFDSADQKLLAFALSTACQTGMLEACPAFVSTRIDPRIMPQPQLPGNVGDFGRGLLVFKHHLRRMRQ